MIVGIILTDRTIQAFSWMLIHSLWQGLLFAGVAGIILMLNKKVNTAVRYNLLLVVFSLFLFTSMTTLLYEYYGLSPVEKWTDNNEIAAVKVVPDIKPNITDRTNGPNYYNSDIKTYIGKLSTFFSEHASFIAMLWLIFFIAKSISLAGGMAYMQWAKSHQIFQPSEFWVKKLTELCKKLQVERAVTLLESGYVRVPVVIGYLKPVILMPVELLAGLPAAQIEAVLLHELAHIRRKDYIINLLQNIAECAFFFNPGLLWVSSLLREEREHCCDDIAIAQMENRGEFVQALISFKEYSLTDSAYAVAFPGQRNQLLNRIMRIAYRQNRSVGMAEKSFIVTVMALIAMMTFGIAETAIRPQQANIPHLNSGITPQEIKDSNISVQVSVPTSDSTKLELVESTGIIIRNAQNRSYSILAPVDELKKAFGEATVTKDKSEMDDEDYYVHDYGNLKMYFNASGNRNTAAIINSPEYSVRLEGQWYKVGDNIKNVSRQFPISIKDKRELGPSQWMAVIWISYKGIPMDANIAILYNDQGIITQIEIGDNNS